MKFDGRIAVFGGRFITEEIYNDIGISVDYFHISNPSFSERCNLFGTIL